MANCDQADVKFSLLKGAAVDLTHGSLFSGIGGFELGARWSGIKTIWNCEILPYNQKILKQQFPNTKQYADIKEVTGPEYCDIISGGFPCQNISSAGNGKGIKGEKSGLWSEMYRICRQVRPRYIIAENSPMLTFRGLERVLCDLSEIGYNAQWQCISNKDFGFSHRRERIYIIAYTSGIGEERWIWQPAKVSEIIQRRQDSKIFVQGIFKDGLFVDEEGGSQSALIGKDDGVSFPLHRIKALGNSVNPMIANYLFECVKHHAALVLAAAPLNNGT